MKFSMKKDTAKNMLHLFSKNIYRLEKLLNNKNLNNTDKCIQLSLLFKTSLSHWDI